MKVLGGVRTGSLGFGLEGFEISGLGFRVLGPGVHFLKVGSPSALYQHANVRSASQDWSRTLDEHSRWFRVHAPTSKGPRWKAKVRAQISINIHIYTHKKCVYTRYIGIVVPYKGSLNPRGSSQGSFPKYLARLGLCP